MKVQLPRNIDIIKSAELEDYFVFYAFNRSDHLFLYVTDKSLNLLKEIEVNEQGYFSSDFHICENNELLFSTTITATTFENKLPETNAYYQYFETKWYKLKIAAKEIFQKKPIVELKEYEFWKKSEIKNIKSKKYDDKIYWISDVQNVRIVNGRYKKSWSFQIAVTNTIDELPRFKRMDIRYSGVKSIDFYVENEIYYVAAICNISWDTPIVFRYDINTEQIQKEELNIKIRKLHHLHEAKLVPVNDKLISYFNSTSHEYSKKYEFRIYKSNTPKLFNENSEISFLNELDYIRNVKWHEHKGKIFSSYAAQKESKVIRITNVLPNDEKLIEEIEDISTIMITKSNELIFSCVKGEPLKKTYLVKQAMKNYD